PRPLAPCHQRFGWLWEKQAKSAGKNLPQPGPERSRRHSNGKLRINRSSVWRFPKHLICKHKQPHKEVGKITRRGNFCLDTQKTSDTMRPASGRSQAHLGL